MPKKNIPLLKRLRTRFLRMRHRKHFNMEIIARQTECGAQMCIAGHALDLQGYRQRKRESGCIEFLSPVSGRLISPIAAARRELGLSMDVAFKLFHDFSLKTPQQAAKRIQRLISDNVPTR